jgi:Ni/Co efflux regulator RcnB
MPFKSEAQRKFFNVHRSELEKQGVDVGEWNRASKGAKLPEHSRKHEYSRASYKMARKKKSNG